jgi:hypothetical protein
VPCRENQPKLTICFHIKDISLAYKIKSFLHYGTVSKIKNKNACTYILTNKFGFMKLLPLLYGKIKQIDKFNRYILLCKYFNIQFASSVSSVLLPQTPAPPLKSEGRTSGSPSKRVGPEASAEDLLTN